MEIAKSTSAKACISKLGRIFATHGIPRKIRTDNGPPFNEDEFKRYMKVPGIEWKTSTPLLPQANGNAESIMKPIGKVIKTATCIKKGKLETSTSKILAKLSFNTRAPEQKSLNANYCIEINFTRTNNEGSYRQTQGSEREY